MRFLIVSKYPPIQGGVAAENFRLVRDIVKRGHEINVLSSFGSMQIGEVSLAIPRPKSITVPFSSAFPPSIFDDSMMNDGIRLVEKTKFDIIYAHYLFPFGCVAAALSLRTGHPLLLRLEGSDVALLRRDKYHSAASEAFEQASFILSSNPDVKRILQPFDIPHEKLIFVPSYMGASGPRDSVAGIDITEISPDLSRRYSTILCAGKLDRHEGVETIVGAVKTIGVPFNMLFLGDGEMADYIRKAAKQVSPAIIALAPYQHPSVVPNILRSCRGLICAEDSPIRGYHRPIMPFEAIQVGCPVIVTSNLTDLSLFVSRTQTGFTFHGNEPESLARGMKTLLTISESEWHEISSRCRNISASWRDSISLVDILEKMSSIVVVR